MIFDKLSAPPANHGYESDFFRLLLKGMRQFFAGAVSLMVLGLVIFSMTIMAWADTPHPEIGNGTSPDGVVSKLHIEVMASSHVNSRKFTIGEIAHISAPEFLQGQLAAMQAGFSPAPGKTKILSGKRIESKIRTSKLFSREMTLVVPDSVYVTRSSQELSIDQLNVVFEDYVGGRMEGMDFEIRDFSVRGLDLYPEGDLFLSSPLHKGGNFKGRVTLYVDVSVDGKNQGRLSLAGWVDIFDDVVCLSRSMPRGSTISPSDLHVKRSNISNLRGSYFRTPGDVVGKELTRSARQNKPLAVNMVTEPPLVQQGDMVKVVASNGNLRIVTLGIARDDGKRDEIIQVENMTSGKRIHAVVTNRSEVNVFY